MSRSRRVTPIIGNTTARSEADDKRQWHKRWRSHQRDQLASFDPDIDLLPVHRQAVSSNWDMAKDGKRWFAPYRQREAAKRIAERRSQVEPERKALEARILARWRAK